MRMQLTLKRAYVAIAAAIALVAATASFYMNAAPLSAFFGSGDSRTLASANSCSLSDAASLDDEIYFVSCGGFF